MLEGSALVGEGGTKGISQSRRTTQKNIRRAEVREGEARREHDINSRNRRDNIEKYKTLISDTIPRTSAARDASTAPYCP